MKSISVYEASKLLGISERTVINRIQKGSIVTLSPRVGKSWLIDPDQFLSNKNRASVTPSVSGVQSAEPQGNTDKAIKFKSYDLYLGLPWLDIRAWLQAVKKYDKDLGLILGRYLLLCGAALSAGFVSYKIKNKVALYDKARGYLGSILGLIELIEKQNSSIMTPVGFNLKIYKDSYDALIVLNKLVVKFPKNFKYSMEH